MEGGARSPRLSSWQVPALLLAPVDALRLLDSLPTLQERTAEPATEGEPSAKPATRAVRTASPPANGDAEWGPGVSLRYLGVVAQAARGLVRRGRVLPQLVTEDGVHAGRWSPVLTGGDAAAFRELAQAMPPVCRAAGGESPAAAVLRDALAGLADAAVRTALPDRLLAAQRPGPRSPLPERWLFALSSAEAALPGARPRDAEELGSALRDWLAAAQRMDGPFRVCFRLMEPVDDDDGWEVEFALQSTDDPSLYVPATRIWAGERIAGLPRRPDETLLAGLGRAVRLCPELYSALRSAQPSGMAVDTAWAFTFLRHAAPLLQAAGYGVQLPAWAGRKGLGLKLTTRSRTGPKAVAGQGFGLAELVDFQIDLAIGDHTISEAELAELAQLKVPLVRVRGQWVELDDRQLKAALKVVERRRSGEMTVGEVIRDVVEGEDEGLPLLDVDADGVLGDLLSGEADRRLSPVATPATFDGVLRPYQERGLSWLAYLSHLGLGGILADDMGLGKCVMPDSPVFVNGTLMEAGDIWARYQESAVFDGEGEWATPSEPLATNSIDASGKVVQSTITRLYRQRVKEPLRRVRLNDGSEITVTRRHRLLGLDGWTTDIAPGDRVCVPNRLVWQGTPVDPDLTVLLAWQISEGHEWRKADLRISQKNRTVLESLHTRIHNVGKRFGLVVNQPTIRADRSVHELRMCSIDYATFLEEHGYRWGRLSAAKRIPDLIMAGDADTVRLFLREYFTAEGSVVNGMRSIEISSASVWLMRQLSTLLRRFGIWLRTVEKMKCATNGTGIKRPYQIGMIGGPGLRVFRDLIGFSDPGKQARLEVICGKTANSNVEGVPGHELLRAAHLLTGLPQRHFGVGTVYFAGTQELSPATANTAVLAVDRMLSGEAEREYRTRPRSKWTADVCASYASLDREELSAIRAELAKRASQQVFYASVLAVEEIHHEGYVYDFEVAEHHNLVAGGMLCHNTAQTLSLLLNERIGPRPAADVAGVPDVAGEQLAEGGGAVRAGAARLRAPRQRAGSATTSSTAPWRRPTW